LTMLYRNKAPITAPVAKRMNSIISMFAYLAF
jgi:hypothetical protein